MEYVSAVLDREEILAYLVKLPSLLNAQGCRECEVSFGWQAELPVDELWKPHRLTLDALPGFTESAMERGIYVPGQSDFFLELPDRELEVRFCHESDIHVIATEDVAALLLTPLSRKHPDFQCKEAREWRSQRF